MKKKPPVGRQTKTNELAAARANIGATMIVFVGEARAARLVGGVQCP